jgi:hypothetical protein
MKLFSKTLLIALFAVFFAGCAKTSDTTSTIIARKDNKDTSYKILPSKIKVIDVDKTRLTFEIISKIELYNNSSKFAYYYLSCSHYKGKELLGTSSSFITLKPFKNKDYVFTYMVKDKSVNGYYPKCKVSVWR